MVSQITLLLGIIFSFKVTSTYSVIQYVASALITFVSAEVLEGKKIQPPLECMPLLVCPSSTLIITSNLIGKCRCEPLPPVKRDVVPPLPWHVQWWSALDRGWDPGEGGRGRHHHRCRVLGRGEAPKHHPASIPGDLRHVHRLHLPNLQLALLMEASFHGVSRVTVCSMVV